MNDIHAKRVTATVAVHAGRARLRGLWIKSATAVGTITFTDGSGGATLYSIDTAVSDNTEETTLPGRGILFETGLYLSALPTGTIVTAYYE